MPRMRAQWSSSSASEWADGRDVMSEDFRVEREGSKKVQYTKALEL